MSKEGLFIKKKSSRIEILKLACVAMAGRTGLEPATSCVTGRRSNQLNYRPNAQRFIVLHAPEKMVGGTGIEPVTSAL